MLAGRLPDRQGRDTSSPSPVGATSSPDNYGYYWDDSLLYSWVETSGGTDTGMSGYDDGVGRITLPFSFQYYENAYSQVYISSSGYLTFADPGYWNEQSGIPNSADPNNVIAPYWTPTYIDTGAWVHYLSGGIAPNRYFVVEWHDLSGGTDPDLPMISTGFRLSCTRMGTSILFTNQCYSLVMDIRVERLASKTPWVLTA